MSWHALLRDSRLYARLLDIDGDLAAQVRAAGCRHCSGRLDRSDYPRKPRGFAGVTSEEYWVRFSFCCASPDCRRRTTPPSVRFLGRRVYLAVVVVLVSAMVQGITPWRAAKLEEALGIDRRTLGRWRAWWLEALPAKAFWQAGRGRFMPPVNESALPESLLERFVGADAAQRVSAALRFLAPLTTSSWAGNLVPIAEPQNTLGAQM